MGSYKTLSEQHFRPKFKFSEPKSDTVSRMPRHRPLLCLARRTPMDSKERVAHAGRELQKVQQDF